MSAAGRRPRTGSHERAGSRLVIDVDRLSASYLVALGARVVREVGDLVRRATDAGKRLAPRNSIASMVVPEALAGAV